MTAPLTYLKVLFLFSASTLLIACHSSSSNDSPTPEINTFHIYTSGQKFYSFNEQNENAGISTKRGEFDEGANKFLELNTDEDKQGFEYAIYVLKNSIYLFNYNKDANGETIKLADISSNQTICGLIPHKTASAASFSDKAKSNRSTLDLPIVTIEYQQDDKSCDPEFNRRDTLTFNSVIKDSNKTSEIKKTQGKAENVLGGLIINYNANATLLTNNDIETYDETGFLGQDLSGNELVFNYTSKSNTSQWETSYYTSTGIQTIHQASSNHVVVRNDEKVYVLNTAELFDINKENDSIPVQDKLDRLFSKETEIFDSNYPITFNQNQNEDTFLLKHDNSLFYYSSPKFTKIPANETLAAQNATKIEFDLTRNNTALVIQETNNIQTLLAISTASGQSTTIISANKIEFNIIDDEFYVNTLESQAGAGWQAHLFKRLNSTYTSKSYTDSRFIFASDLRSKNNTIYLLSSDNESSEAILIKPSLYLFDPAQANGRGKGQASDKTFVDFSFGEFNTDISNIISSRIVNDIYGVIKLNGINGDSGVGQSVEELYYFNPSQSVANPSISEQSLKLMLRKVL